MADNAVAPRSLETQTRSLLDQIADEQAHVASRYMPILSPKQFTEREKLIAELRDMLIGPTPENPQGVDYGIIPGTEKPTLLLPGAQKVCAYFGYVPAYFYESVIEDWTGAQMGEPLFYYRLTCELQKDGKPVGRGLGSCNSWESKYRYRWVRQEDAQRIDSCWKEFPTRGGTIREFTFAVDKAETGGKYGKPAAYWQRFRDEIEAGTARKVRKADSKGTEREAWEIDSTLYRVPNDNFPDSINTVLKLSKKRSYIDATLSATGLSQYFGQDLEDIAEPPPETAGQLTERRIQEETAKRENGWPAEIAPYIKAIPEQGGMNRAMKYVQDELIRTGFPEASAVYDAQAEAMRNRRGPSGYDIPDVQRTVLILFGEVERFRKLKAERDAAAEQSAFGVTR